MPYGHDDNNLEKSVLIGWWADRWPIPLIWSVGSFYRYKWYARLWTFRIFLNFRAITSIFLFIQKGGDSFGDNKPWPPVLDNLWYTSSRLQTMKRDTFATYFLTSYYVNISCCLQEIIPVQCSKSNTLLIKYLWLSDLLSYSVLANRKIKNHLYTVFPTLNIRFLLLIFKSV